MKCMKQIILIGAVLLAAIVIADPYWDYATMGWIQKNTCLMYGVCILDNLTVNNYINATYAEIWINSTLIDGEHWWNSTGDTGLTGTYTGDYDLNTTGDMTVLGNATFNGTFTTTCMHCEDGDVYFHGDGFFEGNVTAPNIEVMESLIVHGNSTCTGTATACGDIADYGLCGLSIYVGQRGCRWRILHSDCVGTATPCEDMSTATCEEQHVCSLTYGSAGFIIDGNGLNASAIRNEHWWNDTDVEPYNYTTSQKVGAREFTGEINKTYGMCVNLTGHLIFGYIENAC